MTVAKAMTECLKAEGISTVFGYPGAAICPFYDELLNTDIRHVLVRHEVNGGHAASGYARMTGRPAVAIATSGPGALNLITAIATAYMDSIPMVLITGQVNTEQIGRDVFQEADITGSAEPFVKHSYLLKNPADTARVFKEAFYIAGSGRRGPVLIDIPYDVQLAEIDFEYPDTVDIRSYRPSSVGNGQQIKRAINALTEAKKPLICAGGGLFTGNGAELMRKFSEITDIPVVSTMMGLGAMPTDSPRYYGMLGMHGCKSANYAVNHCDTLVLLGARVGDRAISAMKPREDFTVIHIDIDPAEIGKNLAVHIPIVGDITLVLGQLLEAVKEPMAHAAWKAELDEMRGESPMIPAKEGYINPKQFMKILDEALPDDSVVVADVGQNQIWSCGYHIVKDGRFFTSGGMGTMGYSIPAAMGAKLADKSKQAVAVCGDGSFQMSMMELATMCQHQIPVKIVVLKNAVLGMVREYQHFTYKDNYSMIDLSGSPDLAQLSKAYNIPFLRLENMDACELIIDEFLAEDTSMILECIIDPMDLVAN